LIICIIFKSNVIHFLSSLAGEVKKSGKLLTFLEKNWSAFF
jgi:hypothetical protein